MVKENGMAMCNQGDLKRIIRCFARLVDKDKAQVGNGLCDCLNLAH